MYAGAAAFYATRPDACGVCGGNGSSCAGCDGVPNSGAELDACGACLRRCSPDVDPACAFQTICPDCAGDVNGTKARARALAHCLLFGGNKRCRGFCQNAHARLHVRVRAGHAGRVRRLL